MNWSLIVVVLAVVVVPGADFVITLRNTISGGRIAGPGVEERLSPLKDTHLNCPGRYAFTASQPARGLRPLHDPQTRDDEEI